MGFFDRLASLALGGSFMCCSGAKFRSQYRSHTHIYIYMMPNLGGVLSAYVACCKKKGEISQK